MWRTYRSIRIDWYSLKDYQRELQLKWIQIIKNIGAGERNRTSMCVNGGEDGKEGKAQ